MQWLKIENAYIYITMTILLFINELQNQMKSDNYSVLNDDDIKW